LRPLWQFLLAADLLLCGHLFQCFGCGCPDALQQRVRFFSGLQADGHALLHPAARIKIYENVQIPALVAFVVPGDQAIGQVFGPGLLLASLGQHRVEFPLLACGPGRFRSSCRVSPGRFRDFGAAAKLARRDHLTVEEDPFPAQRLSQLGRVVLPSGSVEERYEVVMIDGDHIDRGVVAQPGHLASDVRRQLLPLAALEAGSG
jgi:hypothetical protein